LPFGKGCHSFQAYWRNPCINLFVVCFGRRDCGTAGATRLSVSAQPANCPANRDVQKSLAEVRQKFAFSPETVIGILRHVISGALCGAQGIPVRRKNHAGW